MVLRTQWFLVGVREGAYRGLVAGTAAGLLIGTAIFPIIGTISSVFIGAPIGLVLGVFVAPVVALVIRFTNDPYRIPRRSQIVLGIAMFLFAIIIGTTIAFDELHKRGDLKDLIPGYVFSVLTGVVSATLAAIWIAPLVVYAIVSPKAQAEMQFVAAKHHAKFGLVFVAVLVLVIAAWIASVASDHSFYYDY
jgi:hypothetical protein